MDGWLAGLDFMALSTKIMTRVLEKLKETLLNSFKIDYFG